MKINLKKVYSFQASDNRLFQDRVEAARHELMLALRAVIQNGEKNTTNYSASQVADMLVKRQEEIKDVYRSFQSSMNAMGKRRSPRKPVVATENESSPLTPAQV